MGIPQIKVLNNQKGFPEKEERSQKLRNILAISEFNKPSMIFVHQGHELMNKCITGELIIDFTKPTNISVPTDNHSVGWVSESTAVTTYIHRIFTCFYILQIIRNKNEDKFMNILENR